MENQKKAFIYAGITILCWSTAATAFKLSLQGMSPTMLVAISMTVAALILALCIFLKKDKKDTFSTFQALSSKSKSKFLQNSLAQGVLLFVYYEILLMAYELLPAQIAQPVNNTWALMLALLGSWVLKQKISVKEFLFMLLAYAGVVLVASGGGGNVGTINPLGMFYVLASTVLYAIYWITNAKCTGPPLCSLMLAFLVAAILAGLTLLFVEGIPSYIPTKSIMAAFLVGLLELSISFIFWSQALKLSSSVARISTLSFLVPFLSLMWIRLIIKEPILPSTILGLILIVMGTFLQQQTARKLAKPS